MDRPIIESRLDTDWYKLTMGQFIFHRFQGTPVEWALTNRTKTVQLGNLIDLGQVKENLDHIQGLTLTQAERQFLLDKGRDPAYVDYFAQVRLPDYHLEKRSDGQIDLHCPGDWDISTYWETPSLSILNQLAMEKFCEQECVEIEAAWIEGEKRLRAKLRKLQKAGVLGKIIEFGTRRRFSRGWQRHVIEIALDEFPGLIIATSNVALAMEFGLDPKGTNAHELAMGMSGIYDDGTDESLVFAANEVLRQWWDEYGADLSIALTDTYGTEAFLREFTEEQARDWIGQRHDSGRPDDFAEKLFIPFYKGLEIDPRTKICLFSDGLKEDVIIDLYQRFTKKVIDLYGWGTNLTNDLGFQALSLVNKLMVSCGKRTCKLTDNLNKKMGPDEVTGRYIRAHQYANTYREVCLV